METALIGPILALVITTLGCLLSLGILLLLIQGKALPPDSTQPHRIVFKALEVQTSQVVMLLIVSLLAALLPFLIYNWVEYQKMTHPTEPKHAGLKVGATVEEKPGVPASDQDYEASLVKVDEAEGEQPKKEAIICGWKKLRNGEFDCRGRVESLEDTFVLRVRRKNDQDNSVSQYVQPNDQRIIITLSR